MYTTLIYRQNFSSPQMPPGADPDEQLYRVVIVNNPYKTDIELVEICVYALNITYPEAHQIALAVEKNGKAEVLHAPLDEAEKTADKIRAIGIPVEVSPI